MFLSTYLAVPYEVEFADEFGTWWENLTLAEQESVAFGVGLLEEFGIALGRPHADTLHGSRFANMRELRVQHEGRPYRVLYAFDPRRVAYLLIGGEKTGNKNWYLEMLPKADAIYAAHLAELEDR